MSGKVLLTRQGSLLNILISALSPLKKKNIFQHTEEITDTKKKDNPALKEKQYFSPCSLPFHNKGNTP